MEAIVYTANGLVLQRSMTWTRARVRLPLHECGGEFLWDTYAVLCLAILLSMGYSLEIQHADHRI